MPLSPFRTFETCLIHENVIEVTCVYYRLSLIICSSKSKIHAHKKHTKRTATTTATGQCLFVYVVFIVRRHVYICFFLCQDVPCRFCFKSFKQITQVFIDSKFHLTKFFSSVFFASSSSSVYLRFARHLSFRMFSADFIGRTNKN